jgi:hypothetical protein
MIYEYFNKMDPADQFRYIVLVLGCILFMNRLRPNTYTILGMLTGVAIVLYLNSRAVSNIDGYINNMVRIMQLPLFQKRKNLYKDSKLLQFLNEIRIYHAENPYAFTSLTALTDDFIGLSEELLSGSDREYNPKYDILKHMKIRILNIFHAFIYVTPMIESRLTFYQDSMKKLEELLNYHIDKVHTFVVNKNNQVITIHSKFPRRDELSGPPKDLSMSVVNRYNYFG